MSTRISEVGAWLWQLDGGLRLVSTGYKCRDAVVPCLFANLPTRRPCDPTRAGHSLDMATPLWPEGTKCTTMSTGGRRKVHYTFPDEGELVEEYDLQTDELMVRKRCTKTVLGAKGDWVYEVGEPPARMTIENDLMQPSNVNPALVRKDRVNAFEWRIRNLPYPKPTYSVTVDGEARQLVVRTTNKKYFKRISIEDLDRMRLPIEEKALSWTHENNTLVIQYRKPAEVLQREQQAKQERLTAPDEPAKPDGDVDCKQQ